MYNLETVKKKAKLIFKHNYFEIVEEGDYVICAISGKEIKQNLNYWNVDYRKHIFLQKKRMKELNQKKITVISICCVSKLREGFFDIIFSRTSFSFSLSSILSL